MTDVSPSLVFARVAEEVPEDVHENIIVVGSVAVLRENPIRRENTDLDELEFGWRVLDHPNGTQFMRESSLAILFNHLR